MSDDMPFFTPSNLEHCARKNLVVLMHIVDTTQQNFVTSEYKKTCLFLDSGLRFSSQEIDLLLQEFIVGFQLADFRL